MQATIRFVFIFLVALAGCKSQQHVSTSQAKSKARPQWTQTRPIDQAYYIGIGVVSKKSGADYQSTGKKNALNDLVSEIRITVSSNSVLNQQQQNRDFKQTFESETRVAALNTIEGFEAVDSWEDDDNYWVYYRLSKDVYASAKRRKMQAAVSRSETFYKQALSLNSVQDYTQSLRLKIRALAAIQDYLNENIESTIMGRNVSLISDIFQSIQQQLIQARIQSNVQQLSGKVGRAVIAPIPATVTDRQTRQPIPNFPLTIQSDIGRVRSTTAVPTDDKGIAEVYILSIMSREPVQTLKIVPDLQNLISVDSLNNTLRSLLLGMDVSSHLLRLSVAPLQIMLVSSEQNLSKPMTATPFESIIRRQLNDNGCLFTNNPALADYTIRLEVNTQKAQAIWGNMQTADLNLSISLYDHSNKSDVMREGLQQIKGYHANIEQAGMDAYKQGADQFNRQIMPKLMNELFRIN